MNFLFSQYAKESTVYVNFCLLIINKKWDLCKINIYRGVQKEFWWSIVYKEALKMDKLKQKKPWMA